MPNTLTPEQIIKLRTMPELSHYPHRDRKFDFEDSEVIDYIRNHLGQDLKQAIRTFERVRRSKQIVYDPTTKAWMGCETMTPTC